MTQTWTPAEYRDRTGKTLLPQHHAQLIASGIGLEVAAGRGYRSAVHRSDLRDLGFSPRQQSLIREERSSKNPAAVLVVPLWWIDPAAPALHQVRPDQPRSDRNGHAIKYETPQGARASLDVHPSMRDALGDPEAPLLLTEGIKKVDGATTAGLCCVGLLGVDSWKGKNVQGGSTALAGWNDVHLKGRRTYLCFDSDVMTKPAVHRALLRLRTYLESKGADVWVVYLPSGELGAKVGLDDYLAAGHGRDDLLALAAREVRHPDQTRPGAHQWDVNDYRMSPEGTWRVTRGHNGEERSTRLANFAAHIERKDFEDDGTERERDPQAALEGQHYLLVIQQRQRTIHHRVNADSFHAMRWPPEVAAVDLIVASGAGVRDQLREAIELVSEEMTRNRGQEVIPRRTVFVHTGWREIDGRQVYLHAGGGIGQEGAVSNVDVRLDAELRDYELPPPPAGTELVDAIRASLGLLDLGPDEMMVPTLGAVYRAPLAPAAFSLHSAGNSDRFKSEVAALLQQHFGAAWHGKHLPLSWTSTGNAMEGVLHLAKEAFIVADDFLPAGLTNSEREAQLRAANRVFRAQGNQAGRTRMRADTTLRAAKVPRGLLYSTGEEIPPGLSQVARVWMVRQDRDAVTKEGLTAAQGRSPLYSRAMAGYLRWLAPQMGDMAATLRSEVAGMRDSFQAAHRRTSDIAAELEIGWARFCAFALEAGAITESERVQLAARVRVALLHGAGIQGHHQRETNPIEKYLGGLRSAIAAKQVHVTGPGNEVPANPGSWGWQPKEFRSSEGPDVRWEPRGDRIGYLDGDDLFLLPEPAYRAANSMQREGLGIGDAALRAALRDAGRLVKTGDGSNIPVKLPKSIDPVRPRALHLRSDFCRASEVDPAQDTGAGGLTVLDGWSDWSESEEEGRTGFLTSNQGGSPTSPTSPTSGGETRVETWEVGEI